MAVSSSSVAGIIAGRDPLEYESSNPITLFLFQAIFIILLCQVIHVPLSYMKQPRVIAEVISGIFLGPTVLGRIPGFTDRCFPSESIPSLTLVANIGVVLFLFLVGLEVDIKFIKKNLQIALSVGLINMAVPFGFGCVLAIGLHKDYEGEEGVKFTTYMVFVAVAMCITAFPVLARILTELRLLKDRVGTIVLSAGIVNDIAGWMLLALSVTLANAGNGLTTLYILLVTIGWGLFVIYPLRFFLTRIILKKDLQSGTLSRFSIMSILLLVFLSSFFTDIIGVHAIFGAFMVGLIVPRKHGYVVDISNKIEDLVHIVLIPIYFAIAGFKVDLGDISTGKDWAYVFALIFIAIFCKIIGGFIPSFAHGFYWRESLTVGVLMSCKGIVEIIVLSVGLNAGIITSKVFSMFIVMMLVATFLTTPMTLWVYPQSYRDEAARLRKIQNDKEHSHSPGSNSSETTYLDKFSDDEYKFRKVIYNVEDVSGLVTLLNFIELFYGGDKMHEKGVKPFFNAVFLKELTERTADLIRASTLEEDRYHIQLDLLKRVFEFNEVPYVGELKYYVGHEKFQVFLESSESQDDLMIYAVRKDRFSPSIFGDSKISQMGLLITGAGKKIDSLTLCFGNVEPELESFIIYLVRLFISNNHSLNRLRIYLGEEETEKMVEKSVRLLKENLEVDIRYITKLEDVEGLFVVGYDPIKLPDFVEASQGDRFDILALR